MLHHPLLKERPIDLYKLYTPFLLARLSFKGTVSRDLNWLKALSLDRSWLVGLTDDL